MTYRLGLGMGAHLNLNQSAHGHVTLCVLEPRDETARRAIEALQAELRHLEARLNQAADDPLTSDEEYFRLADAAVELRRVYAERQRALFRTVRRMEWDNLILDNGLTQIAAYTWAQAFRYCAVGTGNSTPTASQQALDAEAARTANYLTGTGNCGTTNPAQNVWVHKRTFDFPLGALNGTYAEVGFSPVSSPGPNLFSRSLIQSSGVPTAVTVTSSQQLRVIYTLTVTVGSLTISRDVPNISGWTVVTPSGAVTASQTGTTVSASAAIFASGDVNKAILWAGGSFAVITGYTSATQVTVDRSQSVSTQSFSLLSGTTGQIALQSLPTSVLDTISPSTGLAGGSGILEPSSSSPSPTAFVSTCPTPLATPGTGVDRASGYSYFNGNATPQAYTSGYRRDFKFSMSVNDANFSGIRSAGIGGASNGVLVFLFDSGQDKSNLYTLDLLFTLSWGRN